MPFDAARDTQGIGWSASRRKSQFTINSVGLLTASPEYKAYARATQQQRAFGTVHLYLWGLVGAGVIGEGVSSSVMSRGRSVSMPPHLLLTCASVVAAHTLYVSVWMRTYHAPRQLPLVAAAFVFASIAVFALPEAVAPSGPLVPRSAAAEQHPPLVYGGIFGATFLPGFVLFYLRFATRRVIQSMPIVWHPLAYGLVLLVAVSVLWVAVGAAVMFGTASSSGLLIGDAAALVSANQRPVLARLLFAHGAATALAYACVTLCAACIPARHGAVLSAVIVGCLRLAGVSSGSPWFWLPIVALAHCCLAMAWRLRHALHSRGAWNFAVLAAAVLLACLRMGGASLTGPCFVGACGVLSTLLGVGYLPGHDHDGASFDEAYNAGDDNLDTEDDDVG